MVEFGVIGVVGLSKASNPSRTGEVFNPAPESCQARDSPLALYSGAAMIHSKARVQEIQLHLQGEPRLHWLVLVKTFHGMAMNKTGF